MPKIKVHEKALAHLSRGLYRSPASALRELVSNAWDANATIVRVNTNYPFFLQLSIEDNGDGFTREDFKELMDGGIGNSEKRVETSGLINDRPIIGRLGIGMLGIAQICGAFTVTSKPRDGEGFRARIRLYDLLKESLDKDDANIVKATEIDVGEYKFEDYDPKKAKYGTTIIADDVHPTFVRAFQESRDFEKFKEPPLDWAQVIKILSSNNVHSLQEMGDYWRLLWELSASCPVPYISEAAVPGHLIMTHQRNLVTYDFSLLIDGIKVFKPVYLKGNPGGYTTKKIETQIQKVYGKDLVFDGYIVVQEGLQLRPDELRGIMVRIKNVGIGYYDPSMLDYRFNEGPRSRWVTGEIYVEQGLEDALNIDRDSFNRLHPEFRAIQEYVHRILQHEVFPQTYKQIKVRSDAKKESKIQTRTKHLHEVIAQTVETPVSIKYMSARNKAASEATQATITHKERKVEVELPNIETIDTKKSQRQLASALLAIYEISLEEKTKDKQREVFTHLLLELLSGW